MASYFQGAYRANLAFTLRVTHVADGSTSDFSMAVGDTYDSVDQALTAINAQCVADLGASKVTFAKSGSSANKYSDSISVTTGGASAFSVAWSQAGTGTSFRDWLGEVGDLSSEANGYEFDARHLAGYYPTHGLRAVRRSGTSRPRGDVLAMDATTQTQHTADIADVDVAPVLLSVLMHRGSATEGGFEMLEAFIDELFTMVGAMGGRFSVYHGEDGAEERWVCRLDDEQLRIMPSPVEEGGGSNLYEFDLSAIGVSLPW